MTIRTTRTTYTPHGVPQPSWGVFGPCRRCHANQWIPCRRLNGLAGQLGEILRNPHQGRPKLPRERWKPEDR